MEKDFNIENLADVKELLSIINKSDKLSNGCYVYNVTRDNYYNKQSKHYYNEVYCAFKNDDADVKITCLTKLYDDVETEYRCEVSTDEWYKEICIIGKFYKNSYYDYYMKTDYNSYKITDAQAFECIKKLLIGDFKGFGRFVEELKSSNIKYNLIFE